MDFWIRETKWLSQLSCVFKDDITDTTPGVEQDVAETQKFIQRFP